MFLQMYYIIDLIYIMYANKVTFKLYNTNISDLF